jgi:hypothetical protein
MQLSDLTQAHSFSAQPAKMTNLITHFLFAQFEILTPNFDRLQMIETDA